MADKRKDAPLGVQATAITKRVRPDGQGAEMITTPHTAGLSAPLLALTGAHTAEILDCKFSLDGETIAACSADHAVSLWETFGENKNIGMLRGHARAVTSIAWAPAMPRKDRVLVSGSADETVIVWNTVTGEKIRRFRGHKGIVNSVACPRTGRAWCASGSDDGQVMLWDVESKHPVVVLAFGYPLTAVEFSADATQIYVGGIDNAIHVVDIGTKRTLYSLRGHVDSIASLSLSHSGTHLLSSSLDDTVRVWDVRPFAPEARDDARNPRLYRTLKGVMTGFENILIRAAWSADGEQVASGSADRTCTIWEYVHAAAHTSVEKGSVLLKLPGHRGTVTSVALHPRVPILVSASTDRTLLLGAQTP